MANGINQGFQTSYLQPGGGQGIKPVLSSGIGSVAAQQRLDEFISGMTPEKLTQLKMAAGLPSEGGIKTPTADSLVSSATVMQPVGIPPLAQGISDFLGGIASRQAQTSANLAAIQEKDSDDLGTAPTKPKPTMEEFDDDLGNALNTLEQDLSQERPAALGDPYDETASATTTVAGTVAGALDDTTDKPSNPFAEILKTAMDNVSSIKGEEPKGTIDDYKEEFAKATGVDISGKVDKSQALMALGLSLMQNKAGKGFNVSNALAALGEAGEAATPAFQKAKSEAKAAKLASGKYALGQLSKDEQAKAGRLAAAQATVSDLLGKQQDFFSKLQLQRDQQIADAALKSMEHKNAMVEASNKGVDLYLEKTSKTPLFKDAPDVFKMESYIINPNAKGNPGVLLTEQSVATLQSNLPAMEKALNKREEELKFIKAAVEQGSDVFTQSGAFVQSLGRAFGVNVNSELAPIKQAQILLNKIATQSTAEILGEAGKTISDGDRERVAKIVGEISALNPTSGADRAVLLQKLNSVYDLVVGKGRKNLDTAYGTLTSSGYGGADYGLVPEGYRRAVQAADQAADALDEKEAAELEQLRSGQ